MARAKIKCPTDQSPEFRKAWRYCVRTMDWLGPGDEELLVSYVGHKMIRDLASKKLEEELANMSPDISSRVNATYRTACQSATAAMIQLQRLRRDRLGGEPEDLPGSDLLDE